MKYRVTQKKKKRELLQYLVTSMCSISGERPLDGVNSCHIMSIMDQWNGSQRVFVVKIFRKNGGRFTKQQFGLFCTRRVPTSYQRRKFAVRSFISDSSSVSFSRINPVSKVFWTLDLLPVSKGPNREIWTPSILQSTRAPHNLPPFLVKCFYDKSSLWTVQLIHFEYGNDDREVISGSAANRAWLPVHI